MAHRLPPFQYESEENSTGLTSYAGLPVFLDLMWVMGFVPYFLAIALLCTRYTN